MSTSKTGNDGVATAFLALDQQIKDLLKRVMDQEKIIDNLAKENYELTKKVESLENSFNQHNCLGDTCPHTGK